MARIATPGGPYREGDIVSLAFVDPTIARLLPHAGGEFSSGPSDALVPESVSAAILVASAPYVAGEAVTLSFVDPAIARVHPVRPPAGLASDRQTRITGAKTHSPLRLEIANAATAEKGLALVASAPAAPLITADAVATPVPDLASDARASANPGLALDADAPAEPGLVLDADAPAEPGLALDAGASAEPGIAPDAGAPAEPGFALDTMASTGSDVALDASGSKGPVLALDAEPTAIGLREGSQGAPSLAGLKIPARGDIATEPKPLAIAHHATVPEPSAYASVGGFEPPAMRAVSTAPIATSEMKVAPFSLAAVPSNSERDRVTDDAQTTTTGALLRIELDWTSDRAGRFVRVIDKLFTVDRLGWYRHVLATRLLLAERLVAIKERADLAELAGRATASMRLVRTAGLEALGAPLLAAYLPGFAVTTDWLATLENETLNASLARLCEELATAGIESDCGEAAFESGTLAGPVTRALARGIAAPARGGIDAALPYLIPIVAREPDVTAALSRYRETLLELFAQIAPGAGAVRVRQMAQPNAILDDRLWHLAGAVQQSLTVDVATPA